jgi:membrane-bound ClpP family serine protease
MKKDVCLVFSTAKIISIFLIVFISIFAFDIFSEGYTLGETIGALFIHLLPTFALIAVLVIACKKKVIGGILFFLLGILFTLFFNTYRQAIAFTSISLPLFVIGGLFLLSNYYTITSKGIKKNSSKKKKKR